MSFEIPKEVEDQKKKLVKEFKDDVVDVVCNNCGAKTVMNKMYAKVIGYTIEKCGKCRS
ncbi:MAG: hypothetical protein ACO24H_06355 [Polynucleobacter sp.]